MNSILARLVVGGCCLLLPLTAGCNKRRSPAADEIAAIEKLGALPGIRATQSAELKAELARIEASGGTPKQLLDKQQAGKKGSGVPATPAAVQAALTQIMPVHDLKVALSHLDEFYPVGEFHFDPVAVRQAVQFATQFAKQRMAYTKLMMNDGFQFRIDWMQGLLADLSAVDHARLAHRLLALTVADSLAGGVPDEAALTLRQMFTIDQKLAQVPNVATRLAAARLRGEACAVVQAVVSHPNCQRDLEATILEIVKSQLAMWPPDRDAWIGDRAVGLHTYEMVRDGRLLSILTDDELKELQTKKQIDAFVEAVMGSVDTDEAFYLKAMRDLISACDQPFCQRADAFKHLRKQLDELRDTPRFPLFGDRVLLRGIESGQRQQALDRARCEAWVIALTKATGSEPPPYRINPVTGKPYAIEPTEDAYVIADIDPDNFDYRISAKRWIVTGGNDDE